ncbi:MAG: hypothetical protein KA384_05040 [Leptotrichiaceae bacterium]|nr:hypothetical protein [Leptotrichiaceae bacterium]
MMKRIVEILDTNNYSVNIKADYKNLKKINAYYPSFRNLRLLDKFLSNIEKNEDGSVILSGAYGTGKSHFTSIFLNILDKGFKVDNFKNFLGKSEKIYPIEEKLKIFESKKYFVVFIDDTVNEFSKALLLGIINSSKEVGLELNLATNYEIIERKIKNWQENYNDTFKLFSKKLKIEISQDKFYTLLQEKDKKAIEIFKKIYKEMFAGESFSALEKIQKIDSVLEEVENTSKINGYDGVIYVFDEFGRYLESNIKNLDVKEIQDMAEYCKNENASNFLLITHKDLFQYSEKVDNRESRNEWEKVSGRFLKEHLIYEKNNIMDIISNIFSKRNYYQFRNEHLENFERKENLLKNFADINVIKETEKFYPLDLLTVNILPDLSQKLAQNERTLFAFLCGNEEKGLKNIMKTTDEIFISLADIYDYFEENLKMLDSESSEYKTYINCKNILSKLKDEEYELKKFIKILSLIYIYNKMSDIEPTPEIMRYALGKTDLSDIENVLKERNFINYRRHFNHYKLVEDIDINVDKEVMEYIEQKLSNFDPIETLEKNLKKDIYYPLKYNDRNSINRFMGQYYLDVSDLSRIEKIESNIYEDGKIIYLLNIDGNKNFNFIVEQLREKNNIFIASNSDRKTNILQELKELEAIDRIILTDEKYQKEEILKREIESLREEIKSRITGKLNEYFPKNIDLLKMTDEILSKQYTKYIKINYELINKHNLTFPMKKARLDILKRLLKKVELQNDTYFMDTKAESSVARIILKNTGLYNTENNNLDIRNSVFKDILESILEGIKKEKTSLKSLYEIYCSNNGEYGFRRGVFTFLLGIILVENFEQVSITSSGTNNELNFELEMLDLMEKNSEKYNIEYFNITEKEIEYFNELEAIFQQFINNRDDKIYNRILTGIKNYVLALPRYMSAIYLKNYKGLDRTLKSIFTVNNGKEFLLKELPRNYKSENFETVIKKFYEDITTFENSKEEFVNLLKRETIETLGESGLEFSEIIKKYITKKESNEIKLLISSLSGKGDKEILSAITEKVKGFSFENWRDEKDIIEYKNGLERALDQECENAQGAECDKITIYSSDKEKTIDFNTEETMLGKMLRSKLESSIKNMGISVSKKEKEQILAKILLEI